MCRYSLRGLGGFCLFQVCQEFFLKLWTLNFTESFSKKPTRWKYGFSPWICYWSILRFKIRFDCEWQKSPNNSILNIRGVHVFLIYQSKVGNSGVVWQPAAGSPSTAQAVSPLKGADLRIQEGTPAAQGVEDPPGRGRRPASWLSRKALGVWCPRLSLQFYLGFFIYTFIYSISLQFFFITPTLIFIWKCLWIRGYSFLEGWHCSDEKLYLGVPLWEDQKTFLTISHLQKSCECRNLYFPSKNILVFPTNEDIFLHNHNRNIKIRKWACMHYYNLLLTPDSCFSNCPSNVL